MLEVADLLALRPVSDARISPDGRRVAFVVGSAYEGEYATPEGSRIWLVGCIGYAANPSHEHRQDAR
jgi:dipeptidyl aminopeptidase/acylaminoacyl peptidase